MLKVNSDCGKVEAFADPTVGIAGAFLGSAGTGAALGAAIGGGSSMMTGALEGQREATRQADAQINALALPGGQVRKDFTASGYVFFPKGTYSELQMLVVNSENGNTEVLKTPWR